MVKRQEVQKSEVHDLLHYIVARQRTSVRLKLVVRGDTGAGGLLAPLSCTAYFGS